MKTIKDKKIIILAMILLVFTISYFIIANKISYAFENNNNPEELYQITIDTIKKSAIAYGMKNKDLFKDNDTIYIKVQDLIDSQLLVPDENGNFNNPLKENDTLNSNIIKIKNENDKFTVEVDS